MAGRPSHPWVYAGKNTWYLWLDGKKVSLRVKGETNKAEALKAWRKLMADGKPMPEPKADVTVKAVIGVFLADAQSCVKPVTLDHYDKLCRFFSADHGKLQTAVLTLPMVAAWARKPAWSQSTGHDALGVLATVFLWAERAGLIARSPLVGIRKPPKVSRGAKALIPADERAQIVVRADPPFGAFLRLLWLTGARPSEIA